MEASKTIFSLVFGGDIHWSKVGRLHKSLQEYGCDYPFYVFTPDSVAKEKAAMVPEATIIQIGDWRLPYITNRVVRMWLLRHSFIPLYLKEVGHKVVVHLDGDMLCINKPDFTEIDTAVSHGKVCVALESIAMQKDLLSMIPKKGSYGISRARYFANGGMFALDTHNCCSYMSRFLQQVSKASLRGAPPPNDDQVILNFLLNSHPEWFCVLSGRWNDRTYYFPAGNERGGNIPGNNNVFYRNRKGILEKPPSFFIHRPECYSFILSL